MVAKRIIETICRGISSVRKSGMTVMDVAVAGRMENAKNRIRK